MNWKDAPTMTYFSSRGPNPIVPDIIKPDVTAPGIQILAGNSPFPDPDSTPPGELFQAIAGTSMSSPHVAGIFALLKQAHPEWSAAAAKSALMTTAYQDVLDNDRVSPADPFDMGAGHVNPGGRWNKEVLLFSPDWSTMLVCSNMLHLPAAWTLASLPQEAAISLKVSESPASHTTSTILPLVLAL